MKLIKIVGNFTKDILNQKGNKWFAQCTDNFMYISNRTWSIKFPNCIVPFGESELQRCGVKTMNLEQIHKKDFKASLAHVAGYEMWDKTEVVRLICGEIAVYVDRKIYELVECDKVYVTTAKGIIYFETNDDVMAVALPIHRR